MARKIAVQFSAEEINRSLIYEGIPPVGRLLPAHHAEVEGKVPYVPVLCEKLSELIPNRASFSMRRGFIIYPLKGDKKVTRATVVCSHKVEMPIQFDQESLQPDQALRMTINVKCEGCLKPPDDQEPEPTPPLPEPQQIAGAGQIREGDPVQRDQVIYFPGVVEPNEITPVFGRLARGISDVLTREYHRLSADHVPLLALEDNFQRIEGLCIDAFREEIRNIFPNAYNTNGNDEDDLALVAQQQEALERTRREAEERREAERNQQQETDNREAEDNEHQDTENSSGNAYSALMSGRAKNSIKKQQQKTADKSSKKRKK
jgi:hypothetical protein